MARAKVPELFPPQRCKVGVRSENVYIRPVSKAVYELFDEVYSLP